MRQVLIRIVFKGVIVLIGILLICTILQFMVWLRGSEPIVSTVLEPSGQPVRENKRTPIALSVLDNS